MHTPDISVESEVLGTALAEQRLVTPSDYFHSHDWSMCRTSAGRPTGLRVSGRMYG